MLVQYKYDMIFKYSKIFLNFVFIRVKCNLFKTHLTSYNMQCLDDQLQDGPHIVTIFRNI